MSSLADHRLAIFSQLFIFVRARFQIYYESKLNSSSDFQHVTLETSILPSVPVKYVEKAYTRKHNNIYKCILLWNWFHFSKRVKFELAEDFFWTWSGKKKNVQTPIEYHQLSNNYECINSLAESRRGLTGARVVEVFTKVLPCATRRGGYRAVCVRALCERVQRGNCWGKMTVAITCAGVYIYSSSVRNARENSWKAPLPPYSVHRYTYIYMCTHRYI